MDVIGDVGRYLAFVALVFGLFRSMRRLMIWRMREYVGPKRRVVMILAALVHSAAIWVGLVVVIAPITGVLNLSLVSALLLIPLVALVLGWTIGKLFRVRSGEKTSSTTAAELVDLRHPRLVTARVIADPILMLALLVAGLLVLIFTSDHETTMFRVTFGLVVASAIPVMVWRALVMTTPVLDENTRDAFLADGLTGMIVQVIALGLLLSSLDVPRTEIPLGLADASVTLSLPFLAVVAAYFVSATAVPYAIGVRRASRLQNSLIAEEEGMRDALSKLLLLPRADLYAAGLTEARNSIDERVAHLEADYFYVRFRRESPAKTTSAIADAIDTGDLGVGRVSSEPQQREAMPALLRAATVAPGEATPAGEHENTRDDAGGSAARPIDVVQSAGVVEPVINELSVPSTTIGDVIGRGDHVPSYAEFVHAVADERGWREDDPRRDALRVTALAFETEARHADPVLIHHAWLERVRDLIDSIQRDLGNRMTRTDTETAAHRWSDVVQSQTIELAQRAAGRGAKPGAIVAITTVGALVAGGLVRAAATEVWRLFSGG